MAKLGELDKGTSDAPREAAEIVAKALAGDPDIDWKGTEQQDLATSALEAAIDEKGPKVLDELPAVDPKLGDVVERAREYAEQSRRGTGAKSGGVARENRPPAREATPEREVAHGEGRAEPDRESVQPGIEGTAPSRSELEAAGQGGLFRRRRPPGFIPLQGQPIAFPGMEHLVAEGEQARTEEEKRAMEEQLRTPLADIDKKAGEMERNAPLFQGTDASPQGSLFKRDIGDEDRPSPEVSTWFRRMVELRQQFDADQTAANRLKVAIPVDLENYYHDVNTAEEVEQFGAPLHALERQAEFEDWARKKGIKIPPFPAQRSLFKREPALAFYLKS